MSTQFDPINYLAIQLLEFTGRFEPTEFEISQTEEFIRFSLLNLNGKKAIQH